MHWNESSILIGQEFSVHLSLYKLWKQKYEINKSQTAIKKICINIETNLAPKDTRALPDEPEESFVGGETDT